MSKLRNIRSMTKIGTIIVLLGLSINGYAQSLPVGISENVEDAVRRRQLLGLDSTRNSYMIRPLSDVEHYYTSEDIDKESFASYLRKELFRSESGKIALYLLPFSWKNQYNTDHPYGINDGSMISAKGYQTQLSGGVFAKIGPLSIQLRPEFVFAANNDYRELNETGKLYAGFYNFGIDLPSRFGKGSYNKVNYGQSNVKLTFQPVSFGISTENLWWGPGVSNSLLMSNNATGFKHLFLNTSRPINSPIGSFEAQIIAGRLENSGHNPVGTAYRVKPDDWRYLSGIVFTYQPKWIPNLYLGVDRTFIVYRKKMGNKLGDYLPFLGSVLRDSFTDTNTGLGSEDLKERDQYISLFARWVLPESKAEVYFEFGRNDHPYDFRDGIVEPEHSSAYTAGFKKLVPLNQKDTYIQFGAEVTQLQSANTGTIRLQPPWYIHGQVVAGYTNRGQVLGAGIGPGSNQQSAEVSWVRGLNRIGFRVEHLNNNVDLASQVDGERQDWSDLTFAGKYDWTYNRILFNSKLVYIKSKNYQYLSEGKSNFQLQLGALYSF